MGRLVQGTKDNNGKGFIILLLWAIVCAEGFSQSALKAEIRTSVSVQ